MVCRRWRPILTVRFAARAGFTSVGLRSGLVVREPFGTAMRLITLTRLLRRVDRPDRLRGDSTRVLPIHVEIRVAVGRRRAINTPRGRAVAGPVTTIHIEGCLDRHDFHDRLVEAIWCYADIAAE